MTTTRRPRAARVLSATAAASVALAGLLIPAVSSQAAVNVTDVAPDYLVATYGLPSDHVFETVTIERFEWLLNGKYDDNTTPVTGTFAFLIGGAYDANTKASIGYINEVAKQYGVDTVYTFDPALDGDVLNIFDASAAPVDSAGRAAVEALGTRVLTYLNADTTPGFTKSSTDPYLFIYDRTHTVDVAGAPTEDRIVASLNARQTTASLTDPADVAAYKAQVAAVFDSVSTGGVADTDEIDQFTFWKAEANRRHTTTPAYSNPVTHGGQILSDSDDDAGWRVQTLTYPELEFLLKQSGDYTILFGGTWCHNTRAVIKQINREAQENGVPVVYNFDNSLDSTGNGSSNLLHIRDNALPSGSTTQSRASYLYGDLWNTYLTNAVTQYRTETAEAWSGTVSPVKFYPGGNTTLAEKLARKGQVPFLLTYNKDNLEGGVSAPVTSQWIRQNAGTGGWTEYMIEWWTTPTGGSLSGSTSQLALGAAGEAALGAFFESIPQGGEGIAPQAPAAPTASASGDSVTVTWTAPALAAANTVSSNSTVTGYTVSIDGGTPVSVGRTLRSHTFTGVAPGAHTAKVLAVSPAGSSPASAASNSVTVVAAPTAPATPAAPTASVSGTSVIVNWTAPDNGGSAITGYTVALDGGTPVTLGTVTTHTFTGVAPGAHTATVVAVNAIGSSTASPASASFTVTAPVDPATVVGIVDVAGAISQNGQITISGEDFAPFTTFDVEIHSTPLALGSVTTNAAGAFTFSARIPSSVPAGSHSIVVLYNGAIVSSAAISVAADGSLASTGLDENATGTLIIVSLLALLLGGGLAAAAVIGRRRRSA